jgi:hypothetical protein
MLPGLLSEFAVNKLITVQGAFNQEDLAALFLSHPFNDQIECILLCVPRDQTHIS